MRARGRLKMQYLERLSEIPAAMPEAKHWRVPFALCVFAVLAASAIGAPGVTSPVTPGLAAHCSRLFRAAGRCPFGTWVACGRPARGSHRG